AAPRPSAERRRRGFTHAHGVSLRPHPRLSRQPSRHPLRDRFVRTPGAAPCPRRRPPAPHLQARARATPGAARAAARATGRLRAGPGALGVTAPPPVAGTDVIAAAFASSGKRAALMPYLMGGFPTLAGSRAVGEAYAEAGADLVELGVPFSAPLADGPVIHAA